MTNNPVIYDVFKKQYLCSILDISVNLKRLFSGEIIACAKKGFCTVSLRAGSCLGPCKSDKSRKNEPASRLV